MLRRRGGGMVPG